MRNTSKSYFEMTKELNRRKFIKDSSIAVAGASLVMPAMLGAQNSVKDKVKIGFIGTGLRGQNHVNNLLRNPDVISPAICDVDPEAIKKTLELYKKHGHKEPKVYSSGNYAFKEMLETEDLDGVIIAANWIWHTPMAIAAMEAGVYTGTEVSGAGSVDECWQWVNTHERTGTHLFFLENVCYRRDVMAVLNMVRDDVFGELTHCRGGYQHDLRAVKFDDGNGGLVFGEGAVGEARWRTEHSIKRNGEIYPTHGLGPIATILDINRGNRFTRITAMASKAKSLDNYVKKHKDGGKDHPYTNIDWSLGDVITSTIATATEETIVLTHDTNSPRPYSLGFRVQGVDGLIEFDYGTRRIHVEGKSPSHRWEEAKEWLDKYDHPMWQKDGETATGAGHGGMDFFLDRAFVESVKRGVAPPLDVYDAVALKVITPLSEASIREGGEPQNIPDFTNGKWVTRKPLFGLSDEY